MNLYKTKSIDQGEGSVPASPQPGGMGRWGRVTAARASWSEKEASCFSERWSKQGVETSFRSRTEQGKSQAGRHR